MVGKILKICTIVVLINGISGIAIADDGALKGSGACSTKKLAGRWLFFTDVGRQSLGLGGDGDITALGTMNIDKRGNLTGAFDITVADLFSAPNIGYSGTLTVNSDCIGTLEFVTDLGSMRTDRIAVLSKHEIRAMSLDPSNLWTYWIRRVPGSVRGDRKDQEDH